MRPTSIVTRVVTCALLGVGIGASGCYLAPNNMSYHIPGEEADLVLPVPEFAREEPPPAVEPVASQPERGTIGKVGHFLENRFLDLADIFGVGLLVGQGALLNVRATRVGQAGVEVAEAARIGFNGREAGIWTQQTNGGGIGPSYRVDIDEVATDSNTSDFVGTGTSESFPHRGATDLGFTAMLPIGIGVDVKIDPFLSLADFLGGFVGLDPAGDDEP